MARPTRVDIEGCWYHVTSRGIERRRIFRNDREREHFLELLEVSIERFNILIHSYVLMDNHYHLVVQTPSANLSQAVQWINVSYSVWFNRRNDRVGPLFQGRFKSIPVQDGAWAYELSMYVHLNPVQRGAFGLGKRGKKAESRGYKKPDAEQVKVRLEKIRQYRWSSYRAYGGYVVAPGWLTVSEILSRTSGRPKDRQKGYRRDVRARLSGGMPEEFAESIKEKVGLGAVAFREKVKKLAKVGRESSGKKEHRSRLDLDAAVRLVEGVRGSSYSEFMGVRGDWGRPLFLWCLRNYCGMTLREIGEATGGADYSAVQIMISRFERRAEQDRVLAANIKKLKEAMLYVET